MDIMFNKKSGWINNTEKNKIMNFSDEYIKFLNHCKTERQFVTYAISILKDNGFINVDNLKNIKKGDKVYFNNKNKCLYAMIVGDDIKDGLNIVGSHIDSPRLDLKSNPLYEEEGIAYFKTDYYGGIKKYQWMCIPLTLAGVIVKTDGTKIDINLSNEDITFTISDLLPHLSKNQMDKSLRDAISGEHLNVIVGNIEKEKNEVKKNIMEILFEKYDITERDFNSAELEFVPAFEAKSLGFDKSMIAGYGQDDRVCAYTSLKAFIELENINKTAIIIFSDKEEVGSKGNTGMESNLFNYFISLVLNKMSVNYPNLLDEIFYKSNMLSCDVEAAYDPNFEVVFEKNNSAHLSYGIALTKYTGTFGKSNGSDANAEYLAFIRKLLEENNIMYQLSKLGKSDIGGGGTIAYVLANKGVEVIDCGVCVLSMHSPYEVVSKFDIYELYKFNKIFFES